MAKKRLKGSSTRAKKSVKMKTVSSIRTPSRTGAIMRNPQSSGLGITKKTTSRPKVKKGLRQPGRSAKNYKSPTN